MIGRRFWPAVALVVGMLLGPLATTGAADAATVRLYFARNGELVTVTRAVDAATPDAAMTALIAGPTTVEQGFGVSTEIAPSTALVDAATSGDTATVTLNGAFLTAASDDAVTMRYAQIVYTLTQFPGISAVVVDADTANGAPQETTPAITDRLGKPLARADFETVLGRILFESPGLGDTIGTSVALSGVAKILDGIFPVSIRDRDGNVLGSQAVTFAWSGSYEPFSATIVLTSPPASSQFVFLVVGDAIASASGRSTQKIVVLPLWYQT
jgi:hypothetical protein